AWVDREIEQLFALQRPDGVLEAWYGDGNSARTMWMWALQKTLGITAAPWREDLALGAARGADGKVHVSLHADFAWHGFLRFERPRWDVVMHLPRDYPRINQWPEWLPVARHDTFTLVNGVETSTQDGAQLWNLPLRLQPGETARLLLTPAAAPA